MKIVSNFNQLFVPPSQRDRYQGRLNAPVILMEYGNYQCPQFREMHQLIQAVDGSHYRCK
ncbi:thioredoxin domain-containing protein [Nostoc sp. NZL]|nr:thioredoxin domain-containing protein [Nostoc sp. NZL]